MGEKGVCSGSVVETPKMRENGWEGRWKAIVGGGNLTPDPLHSSRTTLYGGEKLFDATVERGSRGGCDGM